MCEHKTRGRTFDQAWDATMAKVGPYLRGSTVERVQRLFDVEGEDVQEESMEDFMRRVASDAWHGRREDLYGFSLEMLRDGDAATSARPAGRMKAAA
jgi:hypothetical protein